MDSNCAHTLRGQTCDSMSSQGGLIGEPCSYLERCYGVIMHLNHQFSPLYAGRCSLATLLISMHTRHLALTINFLQNYSVSVGYAVTILLAVVIILPVFVKCVRGGHGTE